MPDPVHDSPILSNSPDVPIDFFLPDGNYINPQKTAPSEKKQNSSCSKKTTFLQVDQSHFLFHLSFMCHQWIHSCIAKSVTVKTKKNSRKILENCFQCCQVTDSSAPQLQKKNTTAPELPFVSMKQGFTFPLYEPFVDPNLPVQNPNISTPSTAECSQRHVKTCLQIRT